MATVLDSNTNQRQDQRADTLDLSVVCPFYNEAQILEHAVVTLLEKLTTLDCNWELIIVNDGSTDGSAEIAGQLREQWPQLRVVSYPHNRGRGYALRQGIAQAQGQIIVTTEIDLSWGEDVVHRLYDAITSDESIDIVVASPHLPGGGYRNVPWKRVFFSRFGNRIIRACMSDSVTMNTGMTRAYRREVIQTMPLEEDRKEFHLEVIIKAQALRYRLHEIPCLLEWKEYKLQDANRPKRKSSSKVGKLVVSHTLFSLFANPIRYVWLLSGLAGLFSVGFLCWSFIRLLQGLVSVFTFNISLAFAMIAVMLFAFGVICQQGFMIQREIWTLKKSLLQTRTKRGEQIDVEEWTSER